MTLKIYSTIFMLLHIIIDWSYVEVDLRRGVSNMSTGKGGKRQVKWEEGDVNKSVRWKYYLALIPLLGFGSKKTMDYENIEKGGSEIYEESP